MHYLSPILVLKFIILVRIEIRYTIDILSILVPWNLFKILICLLFEYLIPITMQSNVYFNEDTKFLVFTLKPCFGADIS